MRPIALLILLISAAPFCGSAFAADDPWAAARESLALLDWNQAATQYAALRDKTEHGSQKWVEATFCEAVAQQQQQPASADTINSAASLFKEVIDNARDDRFTARALMNLGRIAELRDYPDDVIDMAGARKDYQQVMQRWPNDPIGSEAALRAGATLVMAYDASDHFAQVKAGIALLEKWLADHPNNAYANVMWQYAGDSYFRPLDDYANSIRCYNEVDKIGWADEGNQGATLWRCAQMADRYLNDPKTAIHYYTEVIEKTPSGGKAYEALQALKRLGGPLPPAPFLEDPVPAEKTQ